MYSPCVDDGPHVCCTFLRFVVLPSDTHRNKRSVALDMATHDGSQMVRELNVSTVTCHTHRSHGQRYQIERFDTENVYVRCF